ncbi:MAG: hypothetical protein LC749_03700, partial [Actinobacteria bacterium]|nr:hypothetical protein [Actinomycetota bacterium]
HVHWYLQGISDGQTHMGVLRDGLVTARCGLVFAPKHFFDHPGAPALPGDLPDIDQGCLRCRGIRPAVKR